VLDDRVEWSVSCIGAPVPRSASEVVPARLTTGTDLALWDALERIGQTDRMPVIVRPAHDLKRVPVVEDQAVCSGLVLETRPSVRPVMNRKLVRVDHPRIIDNDGFRQSRFVEVAIHSVRRAAR
jgi:hypothetical protein